MSNNTYCVYIHRNKINNKVYIGQTIYGDNPNRRWRNGFGYEGCIYFYNAIQKYGWDNFEHIVWADGLTENEANQLEELLISLYATRNSKYGYNIKYGGYNHTFTQNTIDRIKETKKQNDLRKRYYHQEEIEQIKLRKRIQESKEKYEERYLRGDKRIRKCIKCGCYFVLNINFKKRCSAQKLCKNCSDIDRQKMKIVKCDDCGVLFEIASKNNRTHRCNECQDKANKLRYVKYNTKRKNQKYI